MSTLRDWQDDPEAPPPAWEWPTSPARESPPVMGERELFITEESAAQVANTTRSTDADATRPITDIKSRAPLMDPAEKWRGDSSSDP